MRQHDDHNAELDGDDVIERAAAELRRPLCIDAALFDARVMDEVHRGPAGLRARLLARSRPRTLSGAPITALAAADGRAGDYLSRAQAEARLGASESNAAGARRSAGIAPESGRSGTLSSTRAARPSRLLSRKSSGRLRG